jgi:hypothetical protein
VKSYLYPRIIVLWKKSSDFYFDPNLKVTFGQPSIEGNKCSLQHQLLFVKVHRLSYVAVNELSTFLLAVSDRDGPFIKGLFL